MAIGAPWMFAIRMPIAGMAARMRESRVLRYRAAAPQHRAMQMTSSALGVEASITDIQKTAAHARAVEIAPLRPTALAAEKSASVPVTSTRAKRARRAASPIRSCARASRMQTGHCWQI